ncbi:hypothetical protein [Methylobacterium radiotolerans]|uniref:hypothetical protein n=1 Tax=Methylobacterium radiotolerans TaxID=31998 RepID=UPI0009768F61|nr:hypothetical protein [Methylobacterium radiotolerans]ONF46464.1 hypothetical protein RSM1_24505 [Methylobacterium radiotolerans]
MMPDDIPNAPMRPREYVETIVLPTLHELLGARDDRRRAYLACLVVCHVADSLGLAEAARDPGFSALRGRPRRRAVDAATESVQVEVRRRCGGLFEVLQGIANGTKHPGRLPLLPGSERRVPQFSFGIPGAGMGQGRWGAPGLALDVDGEVLFLDACAQQVLAAFMCAYPAHLGGIALAFMDPGLPVPGLDMRLEWLANISAWAGGRIEFAEVWLFGSRANGSSPPDSEVELGVVLAARGAGERGDPCRDWAHESWLASKGMWLGQLRSGVGGRLRLEAFSRPGEPRSAEEAAARAAAILLWTRAYMTDAKLASLSTPDPYRPDQPGL